MIQESDHQPSDCHEEKEYDIEVGDIPDREHIAHVSIALKRLESAHYQAEVLTK